MSWFPSVRCILSHGLSVSFRSILKVPSFCVLSVFVLPDLVPLPPFLLPLVSPSLCFPFSFLPPCKPHLRVLDIVFKSKAVYPPTLPKNIYIVWSRDDLNIIIVFVFNSWLINPSSLLCTCCGEERDAEEVNSDKSAEWHTAQWISLPSPENASGLFTFLALLKAGLTLNHLESQTNFLKFEFLYNSIAQQNKCVWTWSFFLFPWHQTWTALSSWSTFGSPDRLVLSPDTSVTNNCSQTINNLKYKEEQHGIQSKP